MTFTDRVLQNWL